MEFPRLEEAKTVKTEFRKISVPAHRLTPLRENWEFIV
jgi:hypothetical protein